MLGPDRPGLTGRPGPGEPPASEHLAGLAAWRLRSPWEQGRAIWDDDGRFEPGAGPALGRVRVGFWSPCLGLGGAEAQQLTPAKAVDGSAVAWSGSVVIEWRSGEARDETRDRVDRVRRFVLERLGIERFGREWTDLLLQLAPGRRGEGPCRAIPRVA